MYRCLERCGRQDCEGALFTVFRRDGTSGYGGYHVVSHGSPWWLEADNSSYNRINGTAACESDPAMNQILKKELNFQGL